MLRNIKTFLFGAVIAAALSCGGVSAQDGQHTHPVLEGKDAAQDAAIDNLSAAIEEQGAALDALAADVEAIKEQLDGGGPVDPPDPDPNPITPWPVSLLDLDSGALTVFETEALTAPEGRYTIQVGGNEDLADAPFRFRINGNACASNDEKNKPYHACGDNNAAPLNVGANTVTVESMTSGKSVALSVTIEGEAPPTGPPPGNGARTEWQVGPWAWEFSIEEPYLDALHATSGYWQGCGFTGIAPLVSENIIDEKTGLPVSTPDCAIQSGVLFPPDRAGLSPTNHLWDGDWIVQCDGDATLKMQWMGNDVQKQTAPGRLEFTRSEKTRDHTAILFSSKTPCPNLRMFRAENEALLASGKIYNPKFIAEVAKYDWVRTMDIQSANNAIIRSIEDLAPMDSGPWLMNDVGRAEPYPFQGMPIEAAIRLAVEAGKKLWFQAPLTLGAPQPYADFQNSNADVWAHRFAEAAAADAVGVLQSEEWDAYADAFVEALIASDYPEDRELLIALANEVWNWSGHYFATTKYAQLMGVALTDYLGTPSGIREGYGAMTARFKLALDASLARHGRDQKITYVIEGQAAYIELTGAALKGAKAYIIKQGLSWEDHAPGFGVSVASYWGTLGDLEKIINDFNNLAEVEDAILNGDERTLGTKANVIRLFRGAVAQAAPYGVRLVGAYEGGPHFGRPCKTWDPDRGCIEYRMSKEKYVEFIWGEHGGRINFEINKALAEEFPGIILSNYALAGSAGGQVFFEGPLGASNPYADSWPLLIEWSKEKNQ